MDNNIFVEVFVGGYLIILSVLLNTVFKSLDKMATKSELDDTERKIIVVKADLDTKISTVKSDLEKSDGKLQLSLESRIQAVEVESVKKENCEFVRLSFNEKLFDVHKRIDVWHTENKEAHQETKKFMLDVKEGLEQLRTCVTKLSANMKCD